MNRHEEKRLSERIQVEVPVDLGQGMAKTRDISWSGVYFLTEQPFTTGADLHFTLDLRYALQSRPIKLECQAEIIRTEDLGDSFGVAARIRDFRYLH